MSSAGLTHRAGPGTANECTPTEQPTRFSATPTLRIAGSNWPPAGVRSTRDVVGCSSMGLSCPDRTKDCGSVCADGYHKLSRATTSAGGGSAVDGRPSGRAGSGMSVRMRARSRQASAVESPLRTRWPVAPVSRSEAGRSSRRSPPDRSRAAVTVPTPGIPGMPSDGSPTNPMRSHKVREFTNSDGPSWRTHRVSARCAVYCPWVHRDRLLLRQARLC
jgi:hypothetical protein